MNVTWSDISGGIIRVRGAAVLDENNILTHQDANKNATSRRDVPIIITRLQEIVDDTDADPKEYIFNGCSSAILHHAVTRACVKAGVTMVSPHDLRRTFVSQAAENGVPEDVCQKLGGWADAATMRKVYQKISNRKMDNAVASLRDSFQNL